MIYHHNILSNNSKMKIENEIVFHICRHKELADILQEKGVFYTNQFIIDPYYSREKKEKEAFAEKARIKVDSNLPKRTESMYICLEKDLEKWKKIIDYSHWYRIIKLKATGEVFWADNCEYADENYEKYWKGCDQNSQEGQIEGLFQGKYQIIEIIEEGG